jgi:glycosyltransferase involved in cell wall biosynthesis
MGHEVVVLQPHAHEPAAFAFEVVCPGEPAVQPPGAKSVRVRFARDAATWVSGSKRRFDVLHVHGDVIDAYFLSREAKRRGIPMILTVHSGLNTRLRYRLVAAPVLRRPDHIIAVSPRIRQQLIALGVVEQRVSVISSGVETDELSTVRHPGDTTTVHVLAAGRLIQMKGFAYLIEGFRGATLSGDSQLSILGEGPESAQLHALAAEDPRIRLPGQLEHDDLVGALRASDVFVMPSVDLEKEREGTPTALLEAMAASLACIVTDAGGMAALIKDGETGLVVPQRDPAALAAALARLAEDPELRFRLGQQAARSVADRDWAVQAQRVVAIYEEAIRTHGG